MNPYKIIQNETIIIARITYNYATIHKSLYRPIHTEYIYKNSTTSKFYPLEVSISYYLLFIEIHLLVIVTGKILSQS